MEIFGWIRRLLTRLLSPAVLRREILDGRPKEATEAASPSTPPPTPPHRDPTSDTAVMRLEDVRQEARKVMKEVKATCEEVQQKTAKATGSRRRPSIGGVPRED